MSKRPLKYDHTGKRFGKLLVVGLSSSKLSNRTTWDCICDCGKEKKVLGQSLRGGHTRSCGCFIAESTHKRQLKPVRKGGRFGKLKVLEFSHQDKWGNMRFKCLCDCGNIHVTKGATLRSGKTRSCGCGQLEAVTTHGKSRTLGYYKVHSLLRRRRKGRRSNWFTIGDLEDLLKIQNNRCYYCGTKLPTDYHADHKTPLSRNGSNTKENIALTCPSCNLRKGTMTEKEFQAKGKEK